ncbi:MAG: GNAT family N-acetyltransferase, partial [Bacteroidota bacterium]
MEIKVTKIDLKEIQPFRVLFLHENNFQFTYDKCHRYGWADTYTFTLDDVKIGYGSVWGKEKREDRDSIFEFYIIPPYIGLANKFFKEFHRVSGTSFIECQSNDLLLTSMLYEYAQNISAEAILFEDHFQTNFLLPEIIFQKRVSEDNYRDDDRQYMLKLNDEIVATGGLMLNYNIPYADIYYEVNEKYRQRGFGTFIVQKLKKEAYQMGRVPAARCNINNTI